MYNECRLSGKWEDEDQWAIDNRQLASHMQLAIDNGQRAIKINEKCHPCEKVALFICLLLIANCQLLEAYCLLF
jgi:hypothetical protein